MWFGAGRFGAGLPGQQPPPAPPPGGQEQGLPQLPTVVPRPLPGRFGDTADYLGGVIMSLAGWSVPVLFFLGVLTIGAGRLWGNRIAATIGAGMVGTSVLAGVLWASGQNLLKTIATGDFG
ncbi:hypothetical protein [Pseudonocardia sp. ICBG1142]|uniref:hypothetical protein n=1 Tax=Pseudonocardia sp. ICBG1142 TaxID=2846760 RepID=UPI001CF6D69B|nr:hypothetical protein [Pseudonocardia sp. ICBG1142]